MKSLYELRANDEDEEGGAAPSDDEDGSHDKNDSSSDSSSSDSGHDDDDNNTNSKSNNSRNYDSLYNDCGELPSDRKDEDADLFYEEYDDDVDYYDENIEDDDKANRWSDTDSDQYRLISVLEDAREENGQANDVDYDDYPYGRPSNWSYITDVSSRFGSQYDKHGREIPELGRIVI